MGFDYGIHGIFAMHNMDLVETSFMKLSTKGMNNMPFREH